MQEESSEVRQVALDVIAVPNDNPMSDQPTNATIVGTDEVYIVDPGDHVGVEVVREALVARGNPLVRAILLTHGHPDHANAAGALRQLLGCPIALDPREEPIVRQFRSALTIDWALADGMALPIDGGRLEVLDTRGHTPGHVSFYEPRSRTLIAGDLVSGHGTVGIFPPHGEMRAYVDSLARMQRHAIHRIIPGHGPEVIQPPDIFGHYIARRTAREDQIYDAIAREPATIEAILPGLYPNVQPRFRSAAAATILAHLEKLRAEGRVARDGDEPARSRWHVPGDRR